MTVSSNFEATKVFERLTTAWRSWPMSPASSSSSSSARSRDRALGCYGVQFTSDKARGDARRFDGRHGFTASHEGFKRVLDASG